MKTFWRCLFAGWCVLSCGSAFAVTRYVDLNSPSPTPPYTAWATAATNIQDAVDVAVAGDLVLVTNGVYQTGGRLVAGDSLTNRVAVTKAITLQSVNGPGVTVIRGYQVPGVTNGVSAIRCVYLSANAILSGFTVSGGATLLSLPHDKLPSSRSYYGGGVNCQLGGVILPNCVISNCMVVGNAGTDAAGVYGGIVRDCMISNNVAVNFGGGSCYSVLTNCIIVGNTAFYGGGGHEARFFECVITGNSAAYGGGTHDCVLRNVTCVGNTASNAGGGMGSFVSGGAPYMSPVNNSIIFGNTAPTNANVDPLDAEGWAYRFTNCCITPLPTVGSGNFTNAPLFVDDANDDYRLQPNSPCINAGTIISGTSLVDIDGNPRIVGGTVDIGAYEFQSPASVLSYAWAQQNGLPTDGSADFSDADGDGANNWQEWRADTIPTNSVSALRLVSATNSPSGAVVTWQSVPTRNYSLERATNLGVTAPFATIATNIAGVSGVKTFTDTTATSGGPFFYRIGVQ